MLIHDLSLRLTERTARLTNRWVFGRFELFAVLLASIGSLFAGSACYKRLFLWDSTGPDLAGLQHISKGFIYKAAVLGAKNMRAQPKNKGPLGPWPASI